jgi:arylsulfatase A-like enzyme
VRHRRATWLVWALAGYGCARHPKEGPTVSDAAAAAASALGARGASTAGPRKDIALAAIGDEGQCEFGYEGTVLDLGDPSLRVRFGSKLLGAPVEIVERDGSTWARVRSKELAIDFYASLPPAEVRPREGTLPFLEARVRGGAAKTAAFYVNGKLVGATPLVKGEVRIVSFKATVAQTSLGANELFMRFSGAPRNSTDPLAEVDWVHLGIGEPDTKYAVPLRAETQVSTSLLGTAERALSLRASGFVRCAGWIPAGGQVETTLGIAGAGSGDAQIRLLRDRVPPAVLGSVHLEGLGAGEGRTVAFPVGDLGDKAGTLGAIELWNTGSTKGSRVLFGDPKVTALTALAAGERAAPSRGVVLIVLGEMSTRSLAIYGGGRATPEIEAIARVGVVFDTNRATTGLANGSLASMLTGLAARDHAVQDGDARLPRSLTTLADAARQAGIATAFFTANPTTSAAFGFDRGWSTFEAHGPTEDAPATKVLDLAGAWVGEHKGERFLVVVHARGGHPPWDVTAEELKSLDPQNYTGGLDAKHAAELLSHARAAPGSLSFGDADRARAWSLYDLAIASHDAAIGRLRLALKAAGRDLDTTIVVTADVGINEVAHIPFAEASSLEEEALWTPLIIQLPGGVYAGMHVTTPTSGQDVARTVLGVLGLAPPVGFGGVDLVDLAGGRASPFARPLTATLGDRFALRWGGFAETGQRDRETRLCDLSLESACVSDVRATYPLVASLLHAAAFDALVTPTSRPQREPATIDPATAAALRAWGKQ